MKKLVFYICIFDVIFSIEGNPIKIGSANDNYNVCLTENNVSNNDMFTIEDVVNDRHKEPDNEEKIKKNGCVIQCLFEKVGAMVGAEYNVEKIRDDFSKKTNAQPGEEIFIALDNCIDKTKDLTEKCEKTFALAECFMKAEKRIFPSISKNNDENTKA
ncbi:pheromone-binding protein Gp-9-like isoform X1 [Pogonomyrmex barbatus]|uniref:Pheromone-binding protein Gp-9 n=1 Tax=Pogonomyrmex barbatus TaxID=144034 RepID=A0A6I9W4L5_9HYME|nr:pheromone-binding protein Gp-9-like isoform X1 [Pogonomyrmex barbatus]